MTSNCLPGCVTFSEDELEHVFFSPQSSMQDHGARKELEYTDLSEQPSKQGSFMSEH